MTTMLDAPVNVAVCPHTPRCPTAESPDREAARTTREHHDQDWVQLCNGVILFGDTGILLPGGGTILPHRAKA